MKDNISKALKEEVMNKKSQNKTTQLQSSVYEQSSIAAEEPQRREQSAEKNLPFC